MRRLAPTGRSETHYPYWVGQVHDLDRIMTLLLDDSTVENGCLRVAPGSHRGGLQPGKDVAGFGKFELRRALLYTYKPAGHRHTLEGFRPLAAAIERKRRS